LPLLVLPGLLWAYRKRSAMAIAIYAPVLAWWAILQPVAWHWDVNVTYFVGLAGALLLLIAEMHRVGSRLATPYRLYGVLITGGVLITLSYADMNVLLLHHSPATTSYIASLVIVLIGAAAMAGVVVLQQRDTLVSSQRVIPFAAILRRQWLPLTIVLLMAWLCFWHGIFTLHDAIHLNNIYKKNGCRRCWCRPLWSTSR
jgi:hypothetical protein